MPASRAIRSVAVFEALKGALVLVAGAGLLSFVHGNAHDVAAALIRHAHLNPASHYPRIFLDAASQFPDSTLWPYALGAAGYAILRLVEAHGLWHDKAWAEWLAALSSGVYVPFELYGLRRHVSRLGLLALLVNLLVVALMVDAVRGRRVARGIADARLDGRRTIG